MDKEIKTHKRKNKTPVDPGDLVSEKSLNRVYKILGRVSATKYYKKSGIHYLYGLTSLLFFYIWNVLKDIEDF